MPFFRRKRSRERAAEVPAVAVAAEPVVAETAPVVVPVTPPASATPAASENRPAPAEVRSWAKANGLMVNDRGRLPASVYSAYEAARASAV